jgi:hypothetical protein
VPEVEKKDDFLQGDQREGYPKEAKTQAANLFFAESFNKLSECFHKAQRAALNGGL